MNAEINAIVESAINGCLPANEHRTNAKTIREAILADLAAQGFCIAKVRRNAHVVEHGTASQYEYGCRCLECTAAVTAAARQRRARRRAERIEVDGKLVHPDAKHGRESGYQYYSCRCAPCVDAHNMKKREERALNTAHKAVSA